MANNPNPFDFVPFDESGPDLRSDAEWMRLGEPVSGTITLMLKALTPVHIVGKQDAERGIKITHSDFNRDENGFCIPGASVRGMLRGFIEAATNGLVSSKTPFFKKTKTRGAAFSATSNPEELKEAGAAEFLTPVLPKEFDAFAMKDEGIDMASFLFGHITGDNGRRSKLTFPHRIAVTTPLKKYRHPDIEGSALMGGPNPSVRTWWYFTPKCIAIRDVAGRRVVDFKGDSYRGRKFYYHQKPEDCVPFYKNPKTWPVSNQTTVYTWKMACLPAESTTASFTIKFREIPKAALVLLLWALKPGKKVAHKLGYGKAFGYGAVQCELEKLALFSGGDAAALQRIFEITRDMQWTKAALCEALDAGGGCLVNDTTTRALLHVLHWQPHNHLFTYPVFDGRRKSELNGQIKKKGFLPLVSEGMLMQALQSHGLKLHSAERSVTDKDARAICGDFMRNNLRPALHFALYQEKAFKAADYLSRNGIEYYL